ncbi:MAG: hypothetical protein E7165_04005 [Firmicutes bacterium]|nr:hypothetical protein [Bacillota bacterium]
MRGKRREFTDEEINYIITNWGKESPHSMKKKLACTWYAVCKIAEANGLELPTSNNWTEEEITTLKELAEIYHYTEIAKIMGKSENAIYLKAKRLGITLIQDRREWTEDEENLLADLWGNKSIEAIAKDMKRTIFSIKVKAVRMNLGPMIRNNYDLITVSDMEDILNVSRDRIVNTWVKLGLKLKKKRITQNCVIYTITWKDLMEFLENNQNEWDSRNLEKNILGLEPEWLQEKRKKDIEINPITYRKWTVEEIEFAENLFKQGKDYREISVIIKRSEWAVANLLRNLGYSYMNPKYWTGKELKYLRDNYENMTYAEISEILGRTTKAVSAKAEELGYQKKLGKVKTKGGNNHV